MAALPTSGPAGQPVYWVGQDGNYYVKGLGGNWSTQNLGASLVPLSPQTINSMTQIQDPSVQSGPAVSGGGGGGSSTLTVDPAVSAFLGGQIGNVQNALGGLQAQQDVGIQNVDKQAEAALQAEGLNFDQGTRDYNTNRGNTIQDELTAKENIDTGVRQNTNALQRLLGLAGSGSSSASTILAPYAASRVGNVQRQGVQTTYGRNLQGLDTGYGDFTTAHTNTVAGINANKGNAENSVIQGIEGTRQGLLNQLAGLTAQRDQSAGKTLAQAQADIQPYMDQINTSLGKIPGLMALNVAMPTSTAYKAPTLASYNVDNSSKISGAGANNNLPYSDQINPYLVPDPNKQRLTSTLLA